MGLGAPSQRPMVLKVTRQQNLGAQGVCKLHCKEAVVSVGLPNMQTTDKVSQAPHRRFLKKNYASFLISKELGRKNGSGAWEQHFSSLPSASILDGRTDLQSGIRHVPIPLLPRQLIVVPPRSSKAQAGSHSGCWTFLLLHGLFPLASQTTSKHCQFPSRRQGFPVGLLWVMELQNSLSKIPIRHQKTPIALCFFWSLGTPNPTQSIPLYSLMPSLAHPPAATRIPTVTELSHPPGDPLELLSGSAETAWPVPGAGWG